MRQGGVNPLTTVRQNQQKTAPPPECVWEGGLTSQWPFPPLSKRGSGQAQPSKPKRQAHLQVNFPICRPQPTLGSRRFFLELSCAPLRNSFKTAELSPLSLTYKNAQQTQDSGQAGFHPTRHSCGDLALPQGLIFFFSSLFTTSNGPIIPFF